MAGLQIGTPCTHPSHPALRPLPCDGAASLGRCDPSIDFCGLNLGIFYTGLWYFPTASLIGPVSTRMDPMNPCMPPISLTSISGRNLTSPFSPVNL